MAVADQDPNPAKTTMQRAVTFAWSPDAESFLFTAELNSDTAGDGRAPCFQIKMETMKSCSGREMILHRDQPVSEKMDCRSAHATS